MSWDESFATGYEAWSAHMTADVAFYVGLARPADARSSGNGIIRRPG